ncbi:peptidase C65 Otubain-domain-containing protein [Russula compacta]|nr:peptidase C65 Otubain-domain-containing protein [Russula compacta]
MEHDKPTLGELPSVSLPRAYELPDPLDLRMGWRHDITAETDIRSLTPTQLYELNQNHLEDSAPATDPLIAELAPLATLRAEYEGSSEPFVKQIDFLINQGYQGIRRSRGDGDCFYRSIVFAYIERIFSQEDKKAAVAASISTLESFLPKFREVGFEDMVIDDSYEIPRDLINGITDPEPVSNNGTTLTPAQLLEVFQDDSMSSYLVTFMRMLTSAQIRGKPEEYEPFLTHPDTGETIGVKEFCETVVEVLGKEADHVQLTAISQALKVNLKIAYLDGRSQDGRVEFVAFNYASDGNEAPLTLIYRPGHYDILDRRSDEPRPVEIPKEGEEKVKSSG